MRDAPNLLGALGGVVVFLGGVWAIVRGIIRQTDATRDNTAAIQQLTGKVDKLGDTVSGHGQRIARLEGRRPGRG